MALTVPPIGIIAGSGSLPVEGARAIVGNGGSVHVVMADERSELALKNFSHTVVNWAQVGRTMRALKAAGVRDVVMLGASSRPSFRKARPDWGFISALPSILAFLNAGGDDAVLRGLVRLFERHGLNIVGPSAVVPEMLIGEGSITAAAPSDRDHADIAIGFALIRALGNDDIGQAAVVRGGRIFAIEGAEGTDRMLQHAGSLTSASRAERSGVLVKLPKPGQDMRVDLPTIGPATIENALSSGVAGIAVMARHVLAVERERMIGLANANGLFVFGTTDEATAVPPPPRVSSFTALSRKALPERELSDATKAARILATLDRLGTGTALAIFDNRVIVLGTDEQSSDVIRRVASIRRPRRRKGLAAIGPRAVLDAATVTAAHEANLAGLVVVGDAFDGMGKDITALADTYGLFVVGTHIERGTA